MRVSSHCLMHQRPAAFTACLPAVLFAAWVAAPVIAAGPAVGAASGRTLVICAPGQPGDTAEAQPIMDSLAQVLETSAGWPAGSLRAEYHETEDGGLKRLGAGDAVMTLVPLPFFLKHGQDLGLSPRLLAVGETGAMETWNLVVKKGRTLSPASAGGWEITGVPGYSPRFVRRVALAGWGELSDAAQVTFTPRVLSALRRVAAGEDVAVLLDAQQFSALGSLPFGKEIVSVTRSEPLPGYLLCSIGDRLAEDQVAEMVTGFARLKRKGENKELMETLLMVRFESLDAADIERVSELFAADAGGGR